MCRGLDTTDTKHVFVIMPAERGHGCGRGWRGPATTFYVSHSICCVEKINKCVAIKFVVFLCAFMLI